MISKYKELDSLMTYNYTSYGIASVPCRDVSIPIFITIDIDSHLSMFKDVMESEVVAIWNVLEIINKIDEFMYGYGNSLEEALAMLEGKLERLTKLYTHDHLITILNNSSKSLGKIYDFVSDVHWMKFENSISDRFRDELVSCLEE